MSTTEKTQAKSPVTSRGDLSAGGGFTYPARLVEGSQEQLESGNWRLRLVFDRHDRQWADGEPIKQYVNALTTMHEGADPMWEGSPCDIIAASFEAATGGELNVLDDDSVAAFVGHSFILTDEQETDRDGNARTFTDKQGRTRNSYITTCTEYLGPDFEYDGKVTTVQGQNDAAVEADADPAIILASLFSGENIAELRAGKALDLVKDSADLAEVKTVLSKPLKGALVKPKAPLIDILIAEGYGTDEDGTFVAA